ncbi:hypothetical protein MERGE_002446 [Pneumocystis wakefieldiae]|uniref:Uncharacterized protein n=1 Tax=Pneumocystis wakefieldiae TaxID=38082 RepID=A0A899FTN5_9ASCO|nr:hypothetical protein MERGE_002446 [Pneumocystis wakefieldiae]
MAGSRKNGEISSDFEGDLDISSDDEYKGPKSTKKQAKGSLNKNKDPSNKGRDYGGECREIEEKRRAENNLLKGHGSAGSLRLSIKNWANIDALDKTLFEQVNTGIEQVLWPSRYIEYQELNSVNELIVDDYVKTSLPLRVYIGTYGASKLRVMERFSFYSLKEAYPLKTGYIIYTGFPVWGLDWCPGHLEGKQYLAVSGHPDYETHSTLLYTTKPKKSAIQIWSFLPGSNDELSNSPQLEIFIFHAFGSVWDLKWCPLTSKIDGKLGFLAAIFGDGCARIFPIPLSNKTNETLYMKLEQVKLSLKIHDTRCTCLCWISSNRIAIGASNGQICILDLEKKDPNIPIISFFAHTSYIRNIASCSPSYPNLLITSSYDCTVKITDIRDPLGDIAFIQRQRAMNFIVHWWDELSCIILSDNMCGLRFVFIRTLQSSNHIISLDGTLWAIAMSPVHPFLAVAGADGTTSIVNFIRKTFSKLRQPLSIRKIYQLSVNYQDMSYLLVENFKPEKYQKVNSNPIIFPPEIGITVASWNPTKKYGGWLASGSASGILRVEDLSF